MKPSLQAAAFAVASLAVLIGAAPARAESPETTQDIRCMVVVAAASQASEAMRQRAPLAMYYFLGRIDAREPGVDLKTRLIAETDAMTTEVLKTEVVRCGALLQQRTESMQQLAVALSKSRGPGQAKP